MTLEIHGKKVHITVEDLYDPKADTKEETGYWLNSLCLAFSDYAKMMENDPEQKERFRILIDMYEDMSMDIYRGLKKAGFYDREEEKCESA